MLICNDCNENPRSARLGSASRDVVLATLFCCQCEEHFCDVCFQRIHSGGKRAQHKAISSELASPRFASKNRGQPNEASGRGGDGGDQKNGPEAEGKKVDCMQKDGGVGVEQQPTKNVVVRVQDCQSAGKVFAA